MTRPVGPYLYRPVLVVALCGLVSLSACGQGAPEAADAGDSAVSAAGSPRAETPADNSAPVTATIVDGAPAFAAAYPGATPDPAASSVGASGGTITFTTADSPEAVIAFYEAQARQGGLATVSALRQGETEAYAAADPEGRGGSLKVIAAPAADETGQTQVSLEWTATP